MNRMNTMNTMNTMNRMNGMNRMNTMNRMNGMAGKFVHHRITADVSVSSVCSTPYYIQVAKTSDGYP